MGSDRLDELFGNRVQGIQARQRILEDRADLLAANSPHFGVGEIVDPAAIEEDFSRSDPARRRKKSDHGGTGQGLSRSGLADNPQDLGLMHLERDVVDGNERAPTGRELDPKVPDGKEWCLRGGHRLFRGYRSLGFSASRSQSPRRFTDRASATNARLGNAVIHHSPENK